MTEINTPVWLSIKDTIWNKGIIKSTDDEKCIVSILDSGEEILINRENIELRNRETDDVDNLINLPHLNEPSMLNSIKIRYHNSNIYTYTGPILIAINPFKNIDIYSEKHINDYISNKGNLAPHVYGIAREAYNLIKYNYQKDQSILVSGESGAGKTQSTKYIMNYLANVSSSGKFKKINSIENKILQSNPILEAFGNAKTRRNDNSSRFGKFIGLVFNSDGNLIGAEIETYLLERVRLVQQPINERNFHIFYQVVQGLNDPNISYHGTSQDKELFNELDNAMNDMMFSRNEISSIYDIIIGILELDIIEISSLYQDSSLKYILKSVSKFLGINEILLLEVLTKKRIKTMEEVYITDYTQEQAIVNKKSIIKIIYNCLFDWLVLKINNNISCDKNISNESKKYIRILDIFGFEVFDKNSFEQLCINFANETLQKIFTEYTIRIEQEEYKKENVDWSVIKYSDNQKCLDIIDAKPGIFSLLNEQCLVPKGTSDGFYIKVSQVLCIKNNSDVITINNKRKIYNEFTINHYASDVIYDASEFVEKNKDDINSQVQDLLKSSSNIIIKSFDLSKYQQTGGSKISKTVCIKFRSQLADLRAIINKTNPHFIRCLKPNDKNNANNFVDTRVVDQLRYSGILSAVRIARSGYPVKILKSNFKERYSILITTTVENLLDKYISDPFDYQVGKTKIFIKKDIYDKLEKQRNLYYTKYITIIQSNIRRYINYNLYQSKIRHSIRIQTIYRRFYIKKWYTNIKYNIIKIQSNIRCNISRNKLYNIRKNNALDKITSNVITIYYSKRFQNYYHQLSKNRLEAVIKIEKIYKKYLTRKRNNINKFNDLIEKNNNIIEENIQIKEEHKQVIEEHKQVIEENVKIKEVHKQVIEENVKIKEENDIVKEELKQMKKELELFKKLTVNESIQDVIDVMREENEKLHKEKLQTEEDAINLVIRVKKDDMEILDKMRAENEDLSEKLIRMQLLLEQKNNLEDKYNRLINRKEQCSIM